MRDFMCREARATRPRDAGALLVRFGTCGAVRDDVREGTVVVATGSSFPHARAGLALPGHQVHLYMAPKTVVKDPKTPHDTACSATAARPRSDATSKVRS